MSPNKQDNDSKSVPANGKQQRKFKLSVQLIALGVFIAVVIVFGRMHVITK